MKVTLSVSLDSEVCENARIIAKDRDRSLSYIVNDAIKKEIEKHKKSERRQKI